MASFIGHIALRPGADFEPSAAALTELEVVEGLESGQARFGGVSVDWRAAPTAPICQTHSLAGGWCLVIGHVESDDEGDAADPAACLLEKAEKDPASIATFGGYYFAVAVCADGSVCLGGDHLGHFPIYYWPHGERLYVATGPAILRHVPGFRAELDPRGVTSLLLLGHGSRGYTLWRGVRRLDEGAALSMERGAEHRILASRPLVVGGPLLDPADIDEIGEHALQALRPTHPAEPGMGAAVLLSGGIDSRIVAGVLHREGYRVDATVTLGVPGDIELACATRVTRALGIPQVAVPDPSMLQVEDALRFVLAEGFGTGNMAFNFARAIPALRELGVPIVTGFVGDPMLGGTHIAWGRDSESGRISFDALFRRLNQYGLEPETLRSLLRPAFREDCVEQEVAGLRRLYQDLPGHDFQQAWRFDLMHRQRMKIASIAWLLSFGSWPVMPFAQRRLHRIAARLPLELFENRQLQRTMLARYLPKLARLPVDGALYRTLPVVPGPFDGIASALRARRYRLTKRWTGREPRYYARIYDFDGDGFRAIRRRAATALDVLDEVFEPGALRRILPEPDEVRTYADAFAGPGAFRSILGLALLMERTGLAPR